MPGLVNITPPLPANSKQPGVQTTRLYSGAKFSGAQTSKGSTYEVEVTIQYVDLEQNYICGYLKIKGLTDEFPNLTTFFDGEIISEKFPFLTRRWHAKEDTDKKHWSKFESFLPYQTTFNSDEFDYEALKSSDFIFMRWKEHFLVPDHKITEINGASFAGFYYICFEKSSGDIEGYYFHTNSEQFQELKLDYVAERSIPIYEFR